MRRRQSTYRRHRSCRWLGIEAVIAPEDQQGSKFLYPVVNRKCRSGQEVFTDDGPTREGGVRTVSKGAVRPVQVPLWDTLGQLSCPRVMAPSLTGVSPLIKSDSETVPQGLCHFVTPRAVAECWGGSGMGKCGSKAKPQLSQAPPTTI